MNRRWQTALNVFHAALMVLFFAVIGFLLLYMAPRIGESFTPSPPPGAVTPAGGPK